MATESDALETAITAALADLDDNPVEAGAAPEPEPEQEEVVDETAEEPTDEAESPEDESQGEEGSEVDADQPDEDEQAEDDEPETQGTEGEPLEVTEDAVFRLPDGTEVPAKEVLFRQADYTKKTTELADERKALDEEREQYQGFYTEVEDYFQKAQANPVGWVNEIVKSQPNPTLAVAQVLKSLADEGQLSDDFVEAFGLQSGTVADSAAKGAEADRIAKLEAEINALRGETEQDKTEREQAQRRQQIIAAYNETWDRIKAEDGLEFDNPEAERQAKAELIEFAQERSVFDLEVAWAALARSKGITPGATASTSTGPGAKPTDRKKRASRAVTPRSTSNGSAKAPKKFSSVEEAAEDVLKEMVAKRGA